MSNLVRCDSCQGRKKLLSLGGLMKDCPSCRGIGWIDVPPMGKPLDQTLVKDIEDDLKIKKKPGRKPKMVNKEIPLQV